MTTLIVVNNPSRWPLEIPDVQVVSAKAYLTDPEYSKLQGIKVFNLCRYYSYQSLGYYVSLLAEARGHRPLPDIATTMNLRTLSMPRPMANELEEEMQRALAPLKSPEFDLSIYFGRNMANRYEKLALQIFNQFPSPFLRAHFKREEEGWKMASVTTISLNDVPESHRPFIVESAIQYLARKRHSRPRRSKGRYDVAILFDREEKHSPSDPRAIKRFCDAAYDLGINTEIIDKNDYGRIAEFDGLWIRETTSVNHHTYRFARRAQNLGLCVIDDPRSILRCTNKVYLAELLNRHNLKGPRTLIVHEDNIDEVGRTLGLPCVLKRPDGAFSQGVMKAADEGELRKTIELMLQDSDLLIAQEFVPTEYDWRVGVLDRRALYVCRYHMARQHWQIAKHGEGDTQFGEVDSIPVEEAPPEVVKAAVKASNLIGDGLYGVDIKLIGEDPYIIEVNDNPNLEAGIEDAVLKEELWRRLAGVFLRRIEAGPHGAGSA